jgi:hypothetical protein
MKTRSFKKVFALNKRTVANLNTIDMNKVKGGATKDPTETCCCYTAGSCGSCLTSIRPGMCDTDASWCI